MGSLALPATEVLLVLLELPELQGLLALEVLVGRVDQLFWFWQEQLPEQEQFSVKESLEHLEHRQQTVRRVPQGSLVRLERRGPPDTRAMYLVRLRSLVT